MSSLKRKCELIEKFLRNPNNVRFEELDKLLRAFGFEPRQPRKGGSHFTYRKTGGKIITVPYKRPFVKKVYVKQVIKLLDLEAYYEENCRKKS
ncbi:MAG: type II toxin-antitoxin system HicA family toxin [Thermodesulfobacteria bacterium]|nr:type II toxin-antitoxin system HicA family toxin [Thermodesulfobacteriota bacterium]